MAKRAPSQPVRGHQTRVVCPDLKSWKTLAELTELYLQHPDDENLSYAFFGRCIEILSKIIRGYFYAHRLPEFELDEAISLAQHKVWECIGQLQSPDKVNGWLSTIARTAAGMAGRSHRRRGIVALESVTRDGKRKQVLDKRSAMDSARTYRSFNSGHWVDPEGSLLAEEEWALAKAALTAYGEGSNSQMRNVVVMQMMVEEGWKPREIAAKVATSVNNVHQIVSRARKEIRRRGAGFEKA